MGAELIAYLVFPPLVAVVCWFAPARIGRLLTVASGIAAFALAIPLVGATGVPSALDGWLRVDALSVVFVVAVAFLYATTAIFAVGYVRPGGTVREQNRYTCRFFAGINVFAWAMLMAPIVNGLALLWVAIEVTTVVSALLVAIDATDGATEAAWKYVLIASMGLGIALLATIVMYYAGAQVFGDAYELFYPKLLGSAGRFPATGVRLAFVLAVLGFGTKMGLVPVHTWLPDAHSEAPTPVSALLSGALLAVSFYAILRYFQIAVRTLGPEFPRDVLLAFGLASLGLAALYVASQRDLKRLLAYSSVEHMGILAIGMSFSAPIAVVGVLLHVLAHTAAKGTAFFGAGSVVHKFGTKDIAVVRGGIGVLPWSGPMLVLAILGLCAMPPGGMFRSEFLIVSGGLSDPRDGVVAAFVVLVTVASFGLSFFGAHTMLGPTPDHLGPSPDHHDPSPDHLDPSPDHLTEGPGRLVKGEVSWWMVAAMLLGLGGLTLLGVHPPSDLARLLDRAASQLGVPR